MRIYHAGRDRGHRDRDRALGGAGIEVVLVVPREWPGGGNEPQLSTEPFRVVEVGVRRPGDVNRYALDDPDGLARLVRQMRPDLVDLHAEPFSTVVHQCRTLLPTGLPIVGYTAQNLDKRFPPPFAQREQAAYGRLHGLYPCSHQAASVAVGKGFGGLVQVLPLGCSSGFTCGTQHPSDEVLQLTLLGRLLPEKGPLDAVRVLAAVHASRPARLVLVGEGPEVGPARALAAELGVADRLEVRPWLPPEQLADVYASSHVVLVPSHRTARWVEQFGRVVVEAQAAGAIVAAYATGSLPEVVGDAGLIVGEGDAQALVAGVLDVLSGEQRWLRLRTLGLQAAAGRSWAAVAAGQRELYEAVLGSGPPRPARTPPDERRRQARLSHGPPAEVAGGGRPYALPLLRSGGAWARGLGLAQDTLTAVIGR